MTTANWSADWAWGVPLVVLTVLIHISGLVLIGKRAVRASSHTIWRLGRTTLIVVTLGSTTLLVTILHGIEAAIWAAAYSVLRALPDYKYAMLYSLNAITSYGHVNLDLAGHWQLMGALEALNGWLLFGLTTAFLFAMIQKLLLERHLQRPD